MELKQYPDADKIQWKPEFEERYKKLLGDQYETYKKYSLSFLTRSIRINTLKKSIEEVKKRLEDKGWKLTQVPFCKEGFWVEHITGRLDIGNTLEHALGYYYVQEAASMIPPVVLDPEENDLILDMCAAPGSKTTQIGQYLKNTGLLIANDYTGNRIKPLGLNVQRVGLTNTIISRMFGQWFITKEMRFDRILVDAPCSGTGTIRKSLKTLRIWNPTMVERLASTQRKLIETAFQILKPGGTMVYSTCSTEPIENEGTVSYLLENFEGVEVQDIKLNVKSSPAILEFEGNKYHKDCNKALRLWPQDNNTEGFFICKIKKK
jgi:tRNA (cytosine49-C5)-methyltransferase